ncbi:MAG TPA: hypothetical protein VFU63_05340 [Ktedonobacterales bacterium]|nr:hypothetical protein [Ktedonobacterales bacterium]
MRWGSLILGALAIIVGVVWTLQGLNILGGSFMSGNSTWAVIGPIVAIAGLVLVGIGIVVGRRRAPTM